MPLNNCCNSSALAFLSYIVIGSSQALFFSNNSFDNDMVIVGRARLRNFV